MRPPKTAAIQATPSPVAPSRVVFQNVAAAGGDRAGASEMPDSNAFSKNTRVAGGSMLLVGLSVFLVRLQHAGPYALPRGGNLLAGLLALVLGAWLVRAWLGSHPFGRISSWIALAISPVVLFFALYATFAELEEVVVLKAMDRDHQSADLRLWIVDHANAAWVTMPRSKADAHGLSEVEVDLLREGELRCVRVTRIDDRNTVDVIHALRHQKYAVQRIATTLGLFGRRADENTVTLRLDRCERE
jgi:hypothetical protein